MSQTPVQTTENKTENVTNTATTIANNVRQLREQQLISKAELARKAGVSALTIDRVESGMGCRMDTKRKIILALGLKLADRDKVFPEAG